MSALDDAREERDLPNGHAPVERLSPFLARRIRDDARAEAWTTERIREAFIYDGGEAEYHDPIYGAQTQRQVMGGIFDAWLAAHDAEIVRPGPIADAQVDAAAKTLIQAEPSEPWPDASTWGGIVAYGAAVGGIDELRDFARAALEAAASVEGDAS